MVADEFDDGDITKKQFVETILQIALKYTEAKNVVEKKDKPDCETGKEEVGLEPLAAEKQAFALSSGLYKIFADLKIEDKLGPAVDWFKGAGADNISDLEAEDRAVFVQSLALPHIRARKLMGRLSPQEPQMAVLPPMAIPVAPAMPMPPSTSSASLEPTPATAKQDNKEEEEKEQKIKDSASPDVLNDE